MKRMIVRILLMVTLWTMPIICSGQLQNGDIIISEFFDDLFLVDPETNSQTNIYNEDRFLLNLAGSGNTVFSYDFGEGLIEIDLAAGTTDVIADINVNEITFDQTDNLIVSSNLGIQRYDRSLGLFSTIASTGYDDVVVSLQGEIFVTDTFAGVGRLNNEGEFESLFDPGFGFDDLTIGSDGFIYTYSPFDGLHRINPITGEGNMLADDIFSSIDDLVGLENGNLLISGVFDIDGDGLQDDGLYEYNPLTGKLVSVIDESTNNLTFWAPSDVFVVGGIFATIPEPTLFPVVATLMVGVASRRIRKSSPS